MTKSELKNKVRDLVGTRPAGMHVTKEVIKLILKYTGTVCSDDVRFYVKRFDPSTVVIGTAFHHLVNEEVIRKTGSKPTDVKTSKGRDIAVFQAF